MSREVHPATWRPRTVVTGSARSGTKWLSLLLNDIGVPSTHEDVWKPNGTHMWGNSKAVEVSCIANAFDLSEQSVFHLVRHPLDVIPSLIERELVELKNGGYRHANFVHDQVPEVAQKTKIETKAAAYWLHWIDLADSQSQRRFRLEGLKAEDVITVARSVGANPRVPEVNSRMRSSPIPNGTGATRMNYSDLGGMANRVREKARELGYQK